MLADIVRQLAKQGRTIQLTPQLVRPLLPPLPRSLLELYIHHSSRYHFHFSAHQNDNARSATSASGLTQTAAATAAATGTARDQPEARYSSKAEAGRAVDAALMSLNRAPVNCARSRHGAQYAQEAHDFEGLKKQAMQAAKAKNKRGKSSRMHSIGFGARADL